MWNQYSEIERHIFGCSVNASVEIRQAAFRGSSPLTTYDWIVTSLPPYPPLPVLTAPHTRSTQMLQAQLAEDGYLLFRKLLDVDKVLALRRYMHTRTHTRDAHAGSHISGNTLCAHDYYTQPRAHGKTLSWPNLMIGLIFVMDRFDVKYFIRMIAYIVRRGNSSHDDQINYTYTLYLYLLPPHLKHTHTHNQTNMWRIAKSKLDQFEASLRSRHSYWYPPKGV